MRSKAYEQKNHYNQGREIKQCTLQLCVCVCVCVFAEREDDEQGLGRGEKRKTKCPTERKKGSE